MILTNFLKSVLVLCLINLTGFEDFIG